MLSNFTGSTVPPEDRLQAPAIEGADIKIREVYVIRDFDDISIAPIGQ